MHINAMCRNYELQNAAANKCELCHYVISARHKAKPSRKGSIMFARNFTPNPPTFYAIFCAYGRSYFAGGHRTGAEVLQFGGKADR